MVVKLPKRLSLLLIQVRFGFQNLPFWLATLDCWQ